MTPEERREAQMLIYQWETGAKPVLLADVPLVVRYVRWLEADLQCELEKRWRAEGRVEGMMGKRT